MKKICHFIFIFLLFSTSFAQSEKIKVYFTKSVDTTYSKGINAVQLFKSMDDTLVAYLNRAKQTLDIAIYNYTYASTIANIAGAINNAYTRGVKVRIIYDGSVGNTGLNNLNVSIKKLASPQGTNYNIMHNKFVVIDANSQNEATVWTGSANWSNNQFYLDANNAIIIQDKPLALAYKTEFEEMWGDTGATPNITNSRFGQYKTDNTPHQFIIDGKQVELYFSPSDNVNTVIQNTINTADNDFEFCVLQITRKDLASTVKSKVLGGVAGKGIVDPSSLLAGQPAYDTMQMVMGSNVITDNQTNSLLHHKYLISDQSNTNSDPLVLTGSHNWTTSANTMNDENTLIIHDSAIANIYYQEFMARFKESTVLGVSEMYGSNLLNVYPNPFSSVINIETSIKSGRIEVFNLFGIKVYEENALNDIEKTSVDLSFLKSGIYFVQFTGHSKHSIQTIVKY